MKNNYPWLKYHTNLNIEYNNTTMYEEFKKSALDHKKNIAYIYDRDYVSYETLLEKIDESAKAFRRLGVERKEIVSMIMPNTPEAIISIYALNKLGAIVNIINPLSNIEEIEFALKITKTKHLIVLDTMYEKIKHKLDNVAKIISISVYETTESIRKTGLRIINKLKLKNEDKVITYTKFLNRIKNYDKEINICTNGNDEAIILCSGGTTGKPKGVILTNSNINAEALTEININKNFKKDSKILTSMPIHNSYGISMCIHATLLSGAQIVIIPRLDLKQRQTIILKNKPNILISYPNNIEALIMNQKLKKEDLSFIKCVICGGDRLDKTTQEKLNEFLSERGSKAKINKSYGMTETTSGITMMPDNEFKLGCLGIPKPNTYIKICKEKTIEECLPNEVGEICISGPTVMKGYISEHKANFKEHDNKTWLHTGDLGYMDEDGFVYFKSQRKRVIMSDNNIIYPNQIEEIINKHPYVKTSVAIGIPHPYKNEMVKVYIVLKDEYVLNSEIKKSIKEYCEKNIASYALPYAYGYRKELPKTKIGKVAYNELINSEEEE